MPRIGRGIQQQVLKGSPITETPGTVGAQTLAGYAPNIGPQPPQIIAPLPTRQQQTISVTLVAVGRARGQTRYMPPQWYESSETDITYGGVRPSAASIIVYSERSLGPDPPQTLAVPPIQQQQTISVVTFAAGYRRNTEKRRFPLQGWEQVPVPETTNLSPASQSLTYYPANDATGGIPLTDVASQGGVAQQFIHVQGVVTSVVVRLASVGSPVDNIYATIETDTGGHPSGVVLATSTNKIAGNTIPNQPGAIDGTFTFAGVEVTQPIWVVLRRDGALDNANAYVINQSLAYGTSGIFGADGPGAEEVTGTWFTERCRAVTIIFTPFAAETRLQQRFLGPKPPQFLLPLPSQTQQTIGVTYQGATAQRRLTEKQRFPLQGWTHEQAFGIQTTSLLDNFNRTVLGPNWAGPSFGNGDASVVGLAVSGNRATSASSAHGGSGCWRAPFGPDIEVWATTFGGTGASQFLLIASSATGINASGYALRVVVGTQMQLGTINTNAFSQIGPTLPAPASGDKVGLSRVGNKVIAWWQPAGQAWRVTAVVSDTTFNTAGYFIGLLAASNTDFWDDFGGGTIANPVMWMSRRLGPRPPRFYAGQSGLPNQQQQTIPVSFGVAVMGRAQAQRRTPKSLLFPVQTLAQPPPVDATILTRLVQTRPRPTSKLYTQALYLSPLAVVTTPGQLVVKTTLTRTRPPAKHVSLPVVSGAASAFVAPPLNTSLVVPDRIERRRFNSFLNPPTVLQTFAGPAVTLARIRPRPTRHALGPLIFYPQTSVISVTTVKTRPRKTRTFLSLPTVLQVFQGPKTWLTRTRPRPTTRNLGEPTVVRVPSVEQQEQTIRVTLARIRPRPTVRTLGQPQAVTHTIYNAAAAPLVRTRPRPTRHFFQTIVVEPSLRPPDRRLEIPTPLARIRPKPTTRFLRPPAVLQTFAGPVETEVAVRIPLEDKRRPTHSFLRPPQVVRVPSVEQREQTITTHLVQTRPRPTSRFVGPPTVLARPPVAPLRVFTVPRVTRPVHSKLSPPTVVIPLPTLRMQTVTVKTVQTRPRPTRRTLGPPVFYPQTSRISVARAFRTRLEAGRRAPHFFLLPPAVVARAAFFGPDVTLAHIRPRPTSKTLGEPTVLRVFAGPTTHLVQTRPRPTSRLLKPPTKVRVPSVEQAEQTIRVALVRTRPRPTARTLRPPTSLQVFFGPDTTLVKTRPRPTVVRKTIPGVVRLPNQQQQTIRVVLNGRVQTEAVRRKATSRLFPPTNTTPPKKAVLTILTVLVAVKDALRFGRRQPRYRILPPTAVKPQHLYFKVGSPESGWTPGRMTCTGADYTTSPPQAGWATGRLSVDILADETDQDWSAGKPL